MAEIIPPLHDLYTGVKSILEIVKDKAEIDSDALRVADSLIQLLQQLDDYHQYNFRRDIHYKSEIDAANNLDINAWKDVLNGHAHKALQFIVRAMVQRDQSNALSYYVDYHENTFKRAEQIEKVLRYSSENASEISKSKLEIEDLLNNAKKDKNEIASLVSNIKTTETKVETLQKTVTDLNNKAALLEGIKNFEQLANSYKISSGWWAAISLLVTISLILFAFCKLFDYSKFTQISNSISRMFQDGYDSTTVSTTLYIVFAKQIAANFLIVSILIYVLTVAVKNFRSSMHNSVVCRHKAAAIEASKKLVDNTSSPEIEQFILASAANAIFSHQNSGYNDKDESNDFNNISVLTKLLDSVKPTRVNVENDKIGL